MARPLFAAAVAALLLAAVAGGLLRAGLPWPAPFGAAGVARAAAVHAALMLSGFFGTVIAIERAVALRRRWAFAAPAASALGALLLLAGLDATAAACGVAAALLLVAVHTVVLQRQRAAHTGLLLVAASCWAVGNLLFAAGAALDTLLPWWFLLPVLTIAAERLEMTRLMRRHALALPALLPLVALLLAGAALRPLSPPLGGALFGGALTALALWLGVFDIARRTLRAPGLGRYMAVCLLGGYAWLALGGIAWLGMAFGCPGRDFAMHALGLGFIVAMVMGHAPVILPAIARVKLLFGPWFYAPLLLLHATLALRLFGGAVEPAWRRAGAAGNAVALALFALTLLFAAAAWRRRHPATRG